MSRLRQCEVARYTNRVTADCWDCCSLEMAEAAEVVRVASAGMLFQAATADWDWADWGRLQEEDSLAAQALLLEPGGSPSELDCLPLDQE